MLEGGGDHTIVNNSGTTVLHRSAANGHVMMTKFWVVTKGVDVNSVDRSGNTILMNSVNLGLYKFTKLLLSYKDIDVNIKN